MSTERLVEELRRLQGLEQDCDRLRSFIDDGDQDVDLTANQAEHILDALDMLGGALDKRIIEVDTQLEAAMNERMDRFVRTVSLRGRNRI